jgi:hypothetical protein
MNALSVANFQQIQLGQNHNNLAQLNQLSQLFSSFGGGTNSASTDQQRLCVEPSYNPYAPYTWNGSGNQDVVVSFAPIDPRERSSNNLSVMEQFRRMSLRSRDQFASNGIGYFSSPEQDSETKAIWSKLYNTCLAEGKQHLAGNPQDQAVRDQLFSANNQRAEQLRSQGVQVSEEQVLIWHAESLMQSSREGRISSSTGTAAYNFLKIAHAKRQTEVDVTLKNGGTVTKELQPYVRTSLFQEWNNPQMAYIS